MIDSVHSAVNSTPQKVTSRTSNSIEQVRSDQEATGVLSHADRLDISGNLGGYASVARFRLQARGFSQVTFGGRIALLRRGRQAPTS